MALLTDNLISYYKLEDVNDSKSTNHLTNTGSATFPAGKIDSGVQFGSVNTTKYLSIDSSLGLALNGTDNWSIGGWINATSFITDDGTFFASMVKSSAREYGFCVVKISGVFYWDLMVRGSSTLNYGYSSDPATISTATWYHVFYTFVGETAKIYVNGSLWKTYTVTNTGNVGVMTDKFKISGHAYNSQYTNNLWSGMVDEFGVWNRTLTDAEIAILYNSGSGNPYPFLIAPTNLNNFQRFRGGNGMSVSIN